MPLSAWLCGCLSQDLIMSDRHTFQTVGVWRCEKKKKLIPHSMELRSISGVLPQKLFATFFRARYLPAIEHNSLFFFFFDTLHGFCLSVIIHKFQES